MSIKYFEEKYLPVIDSPGKCINITWISSYVPRKCGIATYTKDLSKAINQINDQLSEIVGLVKPEDKISYPPEVKFKINQYEIDSYIKAASYINKSKADLVILQHEFGLYGGEFGEYIIELLGHIKKPMVITIHTIPEDPSKGYGLVLKDVIRFAKKVIVMMPESMQKLIKKYDYPKEKIEVIPHGVPDIPFEPNHINKTRKGLEGKITLGNINLLSEVKGLEYTIEALAQIKKHFNNIIYLVIGQTHPVVLQTAGEKYRDFLKEKIKLYGLEENVKFINEYISLAELIEWLKVIDIYITPYLDIQQSSSGALAYAIGAGKVCISTPYLYAKNVLAKGRGILVPFKNSQAIADAILDICKNPLKKLVIEKKTYEFGRSMTWRNVAIKHFELFDGILDKQISKYHFEKNKLELYQEQFC